FSRDFPKGSSPAIDKVVRLLIQVCIAIGVFLFAINFYAASQVLLHAGRSAVQMDFWGSRRGNSYWVILFGLSIPTYVFMMWKAQFASVAEGRRFRLLTAGLAWGTIPMMATVFLQSVVPAFNSFMRQPPHLLWAGLVLYPLLLSVPIIAAYAVLVHKVLDIRLIIRKALQYAFARYSALTVAVAPVIL